VSAHPSRSYTLDALGRRLPDFVRGARVRRPAFCHDLARLEWAVTEVFDAPETRPLAAGDLAAVAPGDWERARLVPVAALRGPPRRGRGGVPTVPRLGRPTRPRHPADVDHGLECETRQQRFGCRPRRGRH
jgi:hypothetical protein